MPGLLQSLESRDRAVAVIGLGYVGLPLALAMSRAFRVIGFDVDAERVEELLEGCDRTGEAAAEQLAASGIEFTTDAERLADAGILIITVPTPIDSANTPDLSAVRSACQIIGAHMSDQSIVVLESTVYPGVTEEICVAALERASGKQCGRHFKVGYSPERINPGDPEHPLERIVKVVSGQDEQTLDILAEVYGRVIDAGIHRAPSIKTAEAAKVIENAQRDLNIALMNELTLIFHRMGVDTNDVLEAAATKWNFVRYFPGLVGGHCIGVDPYYLTFKAQSLGYHPEVILAGRRINDYMGRYIAQWTVKELARCGEVHRGLPVIVMGITFKENIPDTRNTKVVDIVDELCSFGLDVYITDPLADPVEVQREYGLTLTPFDKLPVAAAVIVAVPHRQYAELTPADVREKLNGPSLLVDVRGVLDREKFQSDGIQYRRL